MSWEHYINCNGYAESYDEVLEYAISLFPDILKDRSDEHCDVKHYIVNWWHKNKDGFKKFTSTTKMAKLLKLDNHSSILHYIHRRVPTHNYEENIQKIKQIINYETEKLREST